MTREMPSGWILLCSLLIVCGAALGCGSDRAATIAPQEEQRPKSSGSTAAAAGRSATETRDAGRTSEKPPATTKTTSETRADAGSADARASEDDDAGTPPSEAPDAATPDETPGATRRNAWTTYGFDHRNSQVNPDERILGADNVGRLKERWRIHMPDGATSTPAVADGVAYFGGWNGNVYAVDADTGEVHWQRRVTASQVNNTPLLTEDRIYVAGGASLIALSRTDGTVIYEVALDTHPTAMVWSSPKLVDGMLIIGVASFENGISFEPTFIGSVVALEAQTGEEIWRVKTSGEMGFGPCYGGPGASVWSSAAIDEELGLAFIGTGQAFNEPVSTCSDSLLALSYRREPQGERIRWFVQFTQGDVFGAVNPWGPDADIGAAPNLFEAGGRALVGVGDKGGSYRTFDRATGELVWRVDFDLGEFVAFGGVVTTAAVSGDTIYVASNHLDAMQWMVDGVHDPVDDAHLYALDTATGAERWKVQLPSGMAGSFAIANGILYHPIINRTLYARDLKTGAELWSTKLGNEPGAGPSIVDGRLYVSAGMALTAVLPTEIGGFVSSYALDAGPTMEREARVDELASLSESECVAKLEGQQLAPDCTQCLCACNATAAGHCGSCTTLASCTASWCALSDPGESMHDCLEQWCNAKLLPSYVFERAVDIGPCVVECASRCGWP